MVFLADTGVEYYNRHGVIYINANDSRRLLAGDWFEPYLPVKFTGRYFYYRNYYGETRKAPMFNIIFPISDNNKPPLPQITEKFYFASKPTYEYPKPNRTYPIPDYIEVGNERRMRYIKFR